MTESDYLARWHNHRATWMERPESWAWVGHNGLTHGPAVFLPANPGMANLLWLATDLADPPKTYDVRDNGLYVLLVMYANSTILNGLAMTEQAACLTLHQFHQQLLDATMHGTLTRYLPVIRLLAQRRLTDAIA